MSDEIAATAVLRYLNGTMRADALHDILEGEDWTGVESQIGSTALRLLYEFDNGDWREPELRSELRRLISPRPRGFMFGFAVADNEFGDKAGIVIRRRAEGRDQTSEQGRPSLTGQRSGIGIGRNSPVLVQ